MADNDLYGCNWLEFTEAFERPDFSKTAVSGREFDIQAQNILNQIKGADQTISISSLSEARDSDAKWRETHGVSQWTGSNLLPHYQEKAFNWPWERENENRQKSRERIAENTITDGNNDDIDSDNNIGLHRNDSQVNEAVSQLPTVGELRCSLVTETPRTQKTSQSISSGTQTNMNYSGNQTQVVNEPHEIWSDSSLSTSFHCDSNELKKQASLGDLFCNGSYYQFSLVSPSTKDIMRTNGISHSLNPPYFGLSSDVPDLPFTYGQTVHNVKSHNPVDLERFTSDKNNFELRLTDPIEKIIRDRRKTREENTVNVRTKRKRIYEVGNFKRARLEYAIPCPSVDAVKCWSEMNRDKNTSQLTHSNANGSAYQFGSLGMRDSISEEMSVCIIEVHIKTRYGKVPKPSEDAIAAVFWQYSNNVTRVSGIITTNQQVFDPTLSVVYVGSDLELLEETVKMVRFYNPDILSGFEIQKMSWGYSNARYSALQGDSDKKVSYYDLISRVYTPLSSWRVPSSDEGEPNVLGRHLLNLWNISRHEVTSSKYTLEYVVYHCLHERTPYFNYDKLHRWWQSGEITSLNAVLQYFKDRTNLVLRLLEHFELINRTCEKSRIIGIDFMSSLTRGSQYQVEAVLCRLARKQNYVSISPSKTQVGQQNALEFIPLVMEPQSRYYTDSVCVLDFRSLYPSIVIAFNLCYSTCLGNVSSWRNRNKVGVKQDFELGPNVLSTIGEENIYVAPNGMAYVTPKVRQSLLAQMLGEILDTRFMVNSTRKCVKSMSESSLHNGNFQRLNRNLNNRQLALKFIANVTYGYTSASFSGRMPLAELADSIVSAGREILEYSIKRIESTENKWGIQPEVVYGDTDSLFVKLPGVTREAAFKIGEEMAEMITQSTPDPILLKLEKVYEPCILLTKKRYVGQSYESPTQAEPAFDAKGIETVRRDGTPIVQKVEKGALQTLFRSSDLSKVKKYLQKEWRRILNDECRSQDFCFAQEVKLGHYKDTAGEGNLPGGAVVSLHKMQKDDGFEPQYRERIPFIVAAGPAGSRINDRVFPPEEFMRSPHLVVDFEYYIQRAIIPPLERLFNLMGANVRDWYTKMPRVMRVSNTFGGSSVGGLKRFLQSDNCSCCLENRRESSSILCKACGSNRPRARYVLLSRHHQRESSSAAAQITCTLCSLSPRASANLEGELYHPCESIDCPVYYERHSAKNETNETQRLLDLF